MSLLIAPKLSAQVAAPPSVIAASPTPVPAEAERVIVTGSNIPTAAEVGPNPVDILTRDRIDKAGERTTEELVRNLTVAGPNGVPASNNGDGPTPGASSISLRGFDASSTLVLIDGHRVAPYPLGTGPDVAAVTFVDLNSIPKDAIDSIEILKDGASSIYGADAVAGVVNFKLRHDYRGAELNIQYGNTLDKDSGEFASSIVFGVGDGDTDITGVMNYYHRNSIFNHDRGYSNTVRFNPSTNASPYNLQLSREAVVDAGVPASALPDDLDTFYGHAPFLTDGTAPAAAYTYTPRKSVVFNYNRYSSALPDSERWGGFVNFDHKICGDQLLVYGDFFYQDVKTHYVLAPTATGPFQTPGLITLAIPPHAPGATPGGPTPEQTGVPVGAFNPFNPFQQIISGDTRARLTEFGNRPIDNETNAFFSTLGLKGDKLFNGTWGYDASFHYSQVQNTFTNILVSATRFDRILNAADPIFDPTSSQFIGTTIPFNPFGSYRVPIPSNADSVAFAVVHPKDINLSKLATVDVNVYTISLFELQAGGIGFAFGGQFRRESLDQNPDDLTARGDLVSTAPVNTTHAAGRKTYAFYAEAALPVFGGNFTAPGLHALELTAAARFEDFRDNDTNVLAPKLGVRWQPFDDSLTLRATWGEGFHEPSLIELFGIPIQGFTGGQKDPLKDNAEIDDVPFITRSNPNLQPEDSRNFTAGIVYTPKFVPGLTLTIDLWDIESTGRAVVVDFQNVIDRAATGNKLPGEAVNRDEDGNITSLENSFQNAGSQKARGIDFGLSYQLETQFGTVTWLTQATWLDSFLFAELPGAPVMELRSGIRPGPNSVPAEGYLKWRANSQIDWAWKGFDLALTAHYLDGFHETIIFISKGTHHPPPIAVVNRPHYVKQTWFFDVRASYQFLLSSALPAVAGYAKDGKSSSEKQRPPEESGNAQMANCTWQRLLNDTTITLGCNNVFGQDPPTAATTPNYADFLYDSTGRFVYLSLTKKF